MIKSSHFERGKKAIYTKLLRSARTQTIIQYHVLLNTAILHQRLIISKVEEIPVNFEKLKFLGCSSLYCAEISFIYYTYLSEFRITIKYIQCSSYTKY